MGYGDEILAAGQAQRWFVEHGEPSVIVDHKGRSRWHPIWEGNAAIVRPEDYRDDHIHRITNAPGCRPYIVYPFTEETGWTFNRDFHARDYPAKIYLTPEELEHGHVLRRRLGTYILIDPWSKHANLRWPIDHWQLLVDSQPEINWVQHVWGDAPILGGVTAVPTPTFRIACGVLASASLYIRGESGMCHAAAALSRPQVTIWGGCMDWDVLGGYDKQFGIVSQNSPCGRWKTCLHCERVMRDIEPAVVSAAITGQLERFGVF